MPLPFACTITLAACLVVGAALAGPPEPDAREVLLSRQLAEARGIAAGDFIQLAADRSGADARPFRVAGIYEPVPDPFRLTARRFEARLHLPDLITLTGSAQDPLAAESVTRINVALEDRSDAKAFARDVQARLPGLLIHPTDRQDDGSDPFVVLERFHAAIAFVTVLGSAAFLLALMVMRSEERRETAGILRLIGLTRPRILFEIFIEGLLVALTGTLFGLALAMVTQGAFNAFFQWHYDTALVFVRITPAVVVRSVAISVPLGVLAGLLASWTLLRRDIMALLKR